jgi:hypothetical protein
LGGTPVYRKETSPMERWIVDLRFYIEKFVSVLSQWDASMTDVVALVAFMLVVMIYDNMIAAHRR